MSKETVEEPPKQPSSGAQVEDKGTEKGEGGLSESTQGETKGERVSTVEQTVTSGGSDAPTASQSEPREETKKPESTPTSEDSKETEDSGTKVVEPPPASTAATTEASSKSGDGGGGGWGWGGWGRSLWSSVSTVTESAQALGQKVQ